MRASKSGSDKALVIAGPFLYLSTAMGMESPDNRPPGLMTPTGAISLAR
jgi:hypothetical protein